MYTLQFVQERLFNVYRFDLCQNIYNMLFSSLEAKLPLLFGCYMVFNTMHMPDGISSLVVRNTLV